MTTVTITLTILGFAWLALALGWVKWFIDRSRNRRRRGYIIKGHSGTP
jgi:hypothetical protein